METRKMRREGVIAIPDTSTKDKNFACKYEIEYYKRNSKKYGIEGGKVHKLIIKKDDELTAEYDKGWIKEIDDEVTKLAFYILMYSHN